MAILAAVPPYAWAVAVAAAAQDVLAFARVLAHCSHMGNACASRLRLASPGRGLESLGLPFAFAVSGCATLHRGNQSIPWAHRGGSNHPKVE
mmetsp:Transcript_11876/g.31189  ORF Transcript_11876/g.31189 Transcript_11876/m.31189 type:complete len:92 (+) Transcript_11876:201-476(+)|eukprot:1353868-Prymnesium_polylepis.2